MFELDEQARMVQKMVRGWCQAQLMPKMPQLESGELMPFELMKQFAKTFGLDQMAGAAVKKRIEKLRAGEEPEPAGTSARMGEAMGGDPMLPQVVIKELSRCSPGFAMGWGVSVGLAAGAIVSKGTPDQIERWGLPLVTAKLIGSWCLTEPGAGSDAFGSMKTVAKHDPDRKDGYKLSGSKTFITNGPGADIFVVYARLDEGIATFIVEKGMPGFSVGKPFKKMGMRDSPTSEIFFEDVPLGPEHLLGGRERGRAGRGDTKESLGNERSGVPAMAWGIIERCYDASLEHARTRQQFGKAIGEFQAVQLKIADLYLKLKLVESVVVRTAWMQQQGVRDPAFTNAAKAWCSQQAVDAAMTAIQIHGGMGYMEEVGIEKLARDAKLLELGAGTTDINLLSAARTLLGV
jgi:alkylation response protein AidB-like acyl-CoA dehydrogenase